MTTNPFDRPAIKVAKCNHDDCTRARESSEVIGYRINKETCLWDLMTIATKCYRACWIQLDGTRTSGLFEFGLSPEDITIAIESLGGRIVKIWESETVPNDGY